MFIGMSAAFLDLIVSAALVTSSHVAGGFSGSRPGLLKRILVDPHHRGGGVERHRCHAAIGQAVIAAHRGDVGARVDLHPGLFGQLPDFHDRLFRRDHILSPDLEDLHQIWRLAGARGRDRRVHYVGVSALVDGLDLDVVLGGVEARCDGIEGVAKRAGHGVPPDDFGLRGLGARGMHQGRGGQCGAAGEQGAAFHNSGRLPVGSAVGFEGLSCILVAGL